MLLASVVRPRQDPAIYYYANTAWGGYSEIMTGESPEVGVFPYLYRVMEMERSSKRRVHYRGLSLSFPTLMNFHKFTFTKGIHNREIWQYWAGGRNWNVAQRTEFTGGVEGNWSCFEGYGET